MKPITAIIYARQTPSPHHQPLVIDGNHTLYLRVEVVEYEALQALDIAMGCAHGDDEIVLNTIELE